MFTTSAKNTDYRNIFNPLYYTVLSKWPPRGIYDRYYSISGCLTCDILYKTGAS